jgi:hypothetical protein
MLVRIEPRIVLLSAEFACRGLRSQRQSWVRTLASVRQLYSWTESSLARMLTPTTRDRCSVKAISARCRRCPVFGKRTNLWRRWMWVSGQWHARECSATAVIYSSWERLTSFLPSLAISTSHVDIAVAADLLSCLEPRGEGLLRSVRPTGIEPASPALEAGALGTRYRRELNSDRRAKHATSSAR